MDLQCLNKALRKQLHLNVKTKYHFYFTKKKKSLKLTGSAYIVSCILPVLNICNVETSPGPLFEAMFSEQSSPSSSS
jgi:hypothetical protein